MSGGHIIPVLVLLSTLSVCRRIRSGGSTGMGIRVSGPMCMVRSMRRLSFQTWWQQSLKMIFLALFVWFRTDLLLKCFQVGAICIIKFLWSNYNMFLIGILLGKTAILWTHTEDAKPIRYMSKSKIVPPPPKKSINK